MQSNQCICFDNTNMNWGLNMEVTEKLEEERKKLNDLVKNQAAKADILEQSRTLDKLINQYYGVA
jgi:hypothetical protein